MVAMVTGTFVDSMSWMLHINHWIMIFTNIKDYHTTHRED